MTKQKIATFSEMVSLSQLMILEALLDGKFRDGVTRAAHYMTVWANAVRDKEAKL